MAPVSRSAHRPLKPLDFSVLLVLAEREDYGYHIVQRIAEPDAGGVRLAPTNLYNVLDRMIAQGLVGTTYPEELLRGAS